VAGSCEHGNVAPSSTKGGEFLDQLSVILASGKRLCSVDLVSQSVSQSDETHRL
jgi:hypothetical protein